jgi:hypothetical protein
MYAPRPVHSLAQPRIERDAQPQPRGDHLSRLPSSTKGTAVQPKHVPRLEPSAYPAGLLAADGGQSGIARTGLLLRVLHQIDQRHSQTSLSAASQARQWFIGSPNGLRPSSAHGPPGSPPRYGGQLPAPDRWPHRPGWLPRPGRAPVPAGCAC